MPQLLEAVLVTPDQFPKDEDGESGTYGNVNTRSAFLLGKKAGSWT
jgi:hypothetical protein